ncbi:MAG: Asp-tRNA(Asn)/Glu-tRNA(Gln) amidotransferase subunit GatB [bacterium]
MDKYTVMIGLEMHCEISETNTKVFSSASNDFSDVANTNIRPLDMAFPGTLPVVNKEAVRKSLKASMIIGCKLPEFLYFERKNYYYPDLPKGYQITQETKPAPVGIYGLLEYDCDNEMKKVRINNIHLEEDSASLDHFDDSSLIDYNRAGVPLLELVTEPDFRNAEEAVSFLETMRRIYQYADISEADSKKGQVRCDVNISLAPIGVDLDNPSNWGTKVEIKNVNSFGAVRDCINYEIKRQLVAKEDGTYDQIEQQTRRWDEESGTTVYMRGKVDAIDYKYFVDPNIPKIKLTDEFIENIRKEIPVLPNERMKKYIEDYKFNIKDATSLVREKDVSDYFEMCIDKGIKPNVACNWVLTQILGYLNKTGVNIKDMYLTPEYLKVIIDNIENSTISTKQAKEIFIKVLEEEKNPTSFIDSNNRQITDEDEIEKLIISILDNNAGQIEAYKNGKTNLFDYFVGQVMKESRGKASPVLTKELLQKNLDIR